MTARLLLARVPAPHDIGWPLLLHACGAYESFIRTHGWAAEPARVAEFLLLDRLFPRSVLHSLVTAEECLEALNPEPVRMGMDDPARRPVGQLRTRLEYADPAQLPDELPELLGHLQQACVEACDAITRRYFQYESAGRLGTGRLSMGWRLRVVHTTEVSYPGAGPDLVQRGPDDPADPARADHPGEPGLGRPGVPVWTYCDYWGTFVSVFDITEPHEALTIRAQATVETGQAPRASPGSRCPGPSCGAGRGGRLLEFLLTTPLTTVTPAVAATVIDAVRGADPVEAAERDRRAGPRAGQLHGRGHRGADQRPGGLGPGPGRLPGPGACHRGAAARGRAARPVRVRLPARRPVGRAGADAVGREPRLGGVLGRLLAAARPDHRRPGAANGTWWSPGAGTTPTSRR